jgi:hypothetical protein
MYQITTDIYYGRLQVLKNNEVVRETVLTVDDVSTKIFNIKAGQQLQSYCCTNVCKHVHTSSFVRHTHTPIAKSSHSSPVKYV